MFPNSAVTSCTGQDFESKFCILVHERPSLTNAENFVYLQQALMGGSSRNSIDALSQSVENYAEAVECLKSKYNRPRLIHKAHARDDS